MQTRIILVTRIAIAVLFTAAVHGDQSGSKPQTFEVVSIKRSVPSQPGSTPGGSRIERPDGGIILTATFVPTLIARAYPGLMAKDFVGLPDWAKSERYDVSATSSLPMATAEDRIAMLRAMLADRFKLAVHIEKRRQPAFELVQAKADGKLGSGIERSKTNCDNQATSPQETPQRPDFKVPPACTVRSVDQRTRDRFGDGQGRLGDLLEGETTMPDFARALRVFSGRPVVDKTNLAGTYRISMNFNMAATMRGPELVPTAGPDAPPSVNDAPTLFEALPKQLGLRLTSAEAEVDVLVIDRLERPTEN